MQRIEDWSSKSLAAQCVFPKLDIEKYIADESYREMIHSFVSIGVGGFCIFNGNTLTVSQLTEKLQTMTDIPLLFSADFENGLPMRLEDGTAFPHSMALGIAGNKETTQAIGKAIAEEAKDIGIHWNLAPVADTNSNPKNPIINIRSFSSDFDKTSEMVEAYIIGTQREKVIATAKHFPGHGDTSVDSHIALAKIEKSLDELQNNELKPFEKAIEVGVKSIMVGHLLVEAIDSEMPATLSRKVVSNLLRKDMDFNGLIVTDALDMKGITDLYSSNDIAILAKRAGNDVLLMPESVLEQIDAIAQEIDNDQSFKDEVVESVKRIYTAKRYCGVVPGFAKLDGTKNIFVKHLNLALRAAIDGTVVECPAGSLPIDTEKQYAAFAILQNDEDMQAGSRFFTMLAQATENDCDFGFIDSTISDDDIAEYLDKLKDAQYLIFAIFARGRAYQGSAELTAKMIDVIERLSAGRPNYLLIFGNPYISSELPSDRKIYAFSDSFPSLAAVVMKLVGRELIDGLM